MSTKAKKPKTNIQILFVQTVYPDYIRVMVISAINFIIGNLFYSFKYAEGLRR